MTFEEAIKAIKSSTHWCGIACDGDGDCYRHGLMYYENVFDIICKLQATYETENQEVLKLKNQIEISKGFFESILDVKPNIRIGSPSHLLNCVNVMKISAENALKRLEEVEND